MIYESLLNRNAKLLDKRGRNMAPLQKWNFCRVSSAMLRSDLLRTNIAFFLTAFEEKKSIQSKVLTCQVSQNFITSLVGGGKTNSGSGNKQGIDHLNTSLNTEGGLFTVFCQEKGIEGDCYLIRKKETDSGSGNKQGLDHLQHFPQHRWEGK